MRRFISILLIVILTWESTGCYAWQPDPAPNAMLQSAKPDDVYRVLLADGRSMEMTQVRLRSDSVFGLADSIRIVHGETERTSRPVAFSAAQVRLVEHRQVNGGAVAATVVVTLGVLAGLTAIALGNMHFGGPWTLR